MLKSSLFFSYSFRDGEFVKTMELYSDNCQWPFNKF